MEKTTKIKKEFIRAIETGNWQSLPEYPVVQGFVKNIAKTLELDSDKMMALLRRDYPPKAVSVNPKPDVGKRFSWSPKFTFIVSTSLVLIAIVTYLVYQYIGFVSPPELQVVSPKEDEIISQESVRVLGYTDPQATVTVNNQPALVDENGEFLAEIEISEEVQEIEVKAISRSGKETTVDRRIVTDLK